MWCRSQRFSPAGTTRARRGAVLTRSGATGKWLPARARAGSRGRLPWTRLLPRPHRSESARPVLSQEPRLRSRMRGAPPPSSSAAMPTRRSLGDGHQGPASAELAPAGSALTRGRLEGIRRRGASFLSCGIRTASRTPRREILPRGTSSPASHRPGHVGGVATILRHPRPGFTWNWWAVDTKGFLVQFNGGAAPEHLLTHVDRVAAAASWAGWT